MNGLVIQQPRFGVEDVLIPGTNKEDVERLRRVEGTEGTVIIRSSAVISDDM